jgi:hypothetical protein
MSKGLRNAFAVAAVLAVSFVVHGASAQPRVEPSLARDTGGDLLVREDHTRFGRRAQWVVSSDAAFLIQRETTSHESGSAMTVKLNPGTDYFVIKNLSVGAELGLTYQKTGHSKDARLMIGPRVGYNIGLSQMFSVWPRIGLSYAYKTDDRQVPLVSGASAPLSGSTNQNTVALNLFAPLMIHPTPHFFAGLGPFVDADLSGHKRSTIWGLQLTIGGWINHNRTRIGS